MTFAENLNRICKEKGTTLTALVKSLGLSTSKVSYWNGGSLPKEDVMVTLAKALNCSVMDFFADEDDLPAQDELTLDDDEKELIRIFRSLSRREKHKFMSRLYDMEKSVDDFFQPEYRLAALGGEAVEEIVDKKEQFKVDSLFAELTHEYNEK